MAFPAVSRWRSRRGRTAAPATRIEEDFLRRYAYLPFETVADRIGVAGIEGRKVGEIGPGDHVPAALLYLGAGAETYTCYDRFAGDIGGAQAKAIYCALVESMESQQPELAARLRERGIVPEQFPEAWPERVRVVTSPIERIETEEYEQLDLLTSYNVVEHVYDVPSFADQTCRMLRPGGLAIHRVDFGPHGGWLLQSNPLEWLTVPDRLWTLMGSKRGTPNRRRFHEIRDELTRVGFEVQCEECEYFDQADLASIRPHLTHRIRQMPDTSLRVKTARFYCRRPGSASARSPAR